MSVLGREIYLYAVLYDRFGPEAISDQVLDANNLDIEFLGYLNYCGRRAMVPSSLMISIKLRRDINRLTGPNPRQPLYDPHGEVRHGERARSGLICPGRPRSDGLVFGSASAKIVSARSYMETPVVHFPPNLSTVIVKGVP